MSQSRLVDAAIVLASAAFGGVGGWAIGGLILAAFGY